MGDFLDRVLDAGRFTVLFAIGMATFVWSITRWWHAEAKRHASNDLRLPSFILAIGVVGTLSFLAVAGLAFATTQVGLAIGLASAALVPACLLVEYFWVRYSVRNDGFAYRTILAGRGFVPWATVQSVRYVEKTSWFRIELTDGRVIRASVIVVGIPRLARALLEGAPRAVLDRKSRAMLRRTAAGHRSRLT